MSSNICGLWEVVTCCLMDDVNKAPAVVCVLPKLMRKVC